VKGFLICEIDASRKNRVVTDTTTPSFSLCLVHHNVVPDAQKK